VTLCASSPDSRAATCRRVSCDETDGVAPEAAPAAVLPERARKMTTPATTATSAAATITGTSGRPGRRGPPEAGASRRSPSIAVDESPDGIKPSTRVASGPAGGGCTPSGGAGHGGGPDGGGGGRRGAYQESQGAGSGGGGAAAGAAGGGNADCGQAGTTGNGAVDSWDGAAPPAAGSPQTGQNRVPGCAGCPHARLPEPATPAIVTAR